MRTGCFVLILMALFCPIAAFCGPSIDLVDRPNLKPSLEHFYTVIHRNYHFTPLIPLADLRKNINKIRFLPIDYMRAGQLDFGFLTAQDKIGRAAGEYGADWIQENGIWKWKFDNKNDQGRSLFPEKKNALGVLGPDGIYIIDGHHKILTSLYYGAATFPITLIEDLSVDSKGRPLTQEQFRQIMMLRHYVFLTRVDGTEADWVPLLHLMGNDPNRYFVTLITTKLKVKMKDGYAHIKERKGSDSPVIVKIGRDSEFFELEFAKRLHAKGIHYLDIYGSRPPQGFIEEAAKVLWEMRKDGDPFLKQVLMFPYPAEISTKDLEDLLNKFLQQNPIVCSSLLVNEDKYF